jgi:diguanylate cyclase (GGDEF)-like protein/PAS domain S-box-containing protein
MNPRDSSTQEPEQDAHQGAQASFLVLRTGLGILIHDPTSRRLLEGASIQLDIVPLLLDESAITLESLARFELIVADSSAMPRIRSIVSTLQEWEDGVRPTLVEVLPEGADNVVTLKESGDGVLVLPQEPASIVSQLSLILFAHRGLARRYQTALEELYLNKTIFQSVSTGITVADATVPGLPLIYVNPAFEVMTGYKFEEIQGNNCRFLQRDDREQPGLALIREALKTQHAVVSLLKNYRKDGTPFWNELSLSPVFDRAGMLTRFVGIQMDVTARVEAEMALMESKRLLSEVNAQLLQLSVTDSLTGLRNRRAFDERLEVALAHARRTGRPFSVVLMDVDHFKKINDEYGHSTGDDVLRELSRLLEKSLRMEDFAARYGGEEFVILLVENSANTLIWTRRYYQLLSQNSWAAIPVTVSMGIAEVNLQADDASAIIQRADEALYRAKREGRARAIIHSG